MGFPLQLLTKLVQIDLESENETVKNNDVKRANLATRISVGTSITRGRTSTSLFAVRACRTFPSFAREVSLRLHFVHP